VESIRRDFEFLDKRVLYKEILMYSFYVRLSSDSSGYYFPENTIADFKTKLTTPVELEHIKWTVGLAEISHPKRYKKGTVQCTSFRLGGNHISCKTL